MLALATRITLLLALVVNSVALPATSGGAAQTDSTETGLIEVQVVSCPISVNESDRAEACDRPIQGYRIILSGPGRQGDVSEALLGTVRFEGLPAGEYTLAETVMTGDFADYAVVCGDSTGTSILTEERGNGRAAVLLSLEQGQQIACIWYLLPPGASGNATKDAGSFALPATGTGAPATRPELLAPVLLGTCAVLLAIAGATIDHRKSR